MLNLKSIIIVVGLLISNNIYAQFGEEEEEEVAEILHPCNDTVLEVVRPSVGRESKLNYWNGTIDFTKFPNTEKAHITLVLASPANVSFYYRKDGRVTAKSRKEYLIRFSKKENNTFGGEFRVQGPRNGKSPSLVKLYLNGEDICGEITPFEQKTPPSEGALHTDPETGAQSIYMRDPYNPSRFDFWSLMPDNKEGSDNALTEVITKSTPTEQPRRATTTSTTSSSTTSTTTASTTPSSTPTSTAKSTQADACGRRIVQHLGLITNGNPTREGEWPWHAAILHIDFQISKYKCGGTLISSKIVVTAGHCVVEFTQVLIPERIVIRLGQYNRLFVDENTREYRVFDIIPHENFDLAELRNDIALLKLATRVTFTNYIRPICLWDENSIDVSSIVNARGYVVGWGFNENDNLSDILMEATMPVVSLTTCLNSNRPFYGNYLSDTNYCAGDRNTTSVCNGDSGGGMYFNNGEVYRLRGIVSLSVVRKDKNLCDPEHYVIFTDCAKYLDWIKANL